MSSASGVALSKDSQKNKKLVTDFFTLAFVDKKIKKAFDKYVSDAYIQHDPNLPDGKAPAIEFLTQIFLQDNPGTTISIKKVIAEGDLVTIYHHSRSNKEDRGMAVIEIYRVEKGKIIEHWDIFQAVPEKSANNNTMF